MKKPLKKISGFFLFKNGSSLISMVTCESSKNKARIVFNLRPSAKSADKEDYKRSAVDTDVLRWDTGTIFCDSSWDNANQGADVISSFQKCRFSHKHIVCISETEEINARGNTVFRRE